MDHIASLAYRPANATRQLRQSTCLENGTVLGSAEKMVWPRQTSTGRIMVDSNVALTATGELTITQVVG